MSKVVVTGGNGFLGAWLIRRLLQDGHQVSVLVRKTSDLSELEGLICEYVYGDVTDLPSLIKAFEGADTVFHLAGLIAYKRKDRAKMEMINVHGTANTVEAVKICKVRQLVHISSMVAVGAGFTEKEVLNEDSPFKLSHLNLGYFETKRAAEQIVQKAVQAGEIKAVILNPTTVYGAGDARKGSRKTQMKVAQGQVPFYTPGGVSVVAVEDVVDGIISGWIVGRNGERYILCSENVTIKQLFTMIAEEAHVPPPTWQIPRFVLFLAGLIGDILGRLGFDNQLSLENYYTATLYHWGDYSKAQRELGFNPRPAREAIHNSIEWAKQKGLLK